MGRRDAQPNPQRRRTNARIFVPGSTLLSEHAATSGTTYLCKVPRTGPPPFMKLQDTVIVELVSKLVGYRLQRGSHLRWTESLFLEAASNRRHAWWMETEAETDCISIPDTDTLVPDTKSCNSAPCGTETGLSEQNNSFARAPANASPEPLRKTCKPHSQPSYSGDADGPRDRDAHPGRRGVCQPLRAARDAASIHG